MKIILVAIALLLIASTSFNSASAQTDTRGQSVRIKSESGKEINLYSGSYALIIGVNDYTNGWADLPDVVNDMVEVKKALEAQSFSVETISNPTRTQFDAKVRDFIARYGQTKDNRLLFYFSGHGHTLQTNDNRQRELGYIVPADAPLPRDDNVGIFKSYAVSMNEINNYAEQIEAKHVLFVFDSCFSGSIFKSRSGGIPEPIKDKTSEPVRQFITAGTEKQAVPAVSVFRRVFVNGLKGEADMNRDGYITGVELGEYLHNEVTAQSKRLQTPQHGKILNPDLNQGDFVFSLGGKIQTVALSPEDTLWQQVIEKGAADDYREYLKKYPEGKYVDQARGQLRALIGASSSTSTETPANTNKSGSWELVEEKNIPVQANAPWTPTSMKVEAGQQVAINGGAKQISLGSNGSSGPEGIFKDDPKRPAPSCQTGALIARVGDQIACVGREATFTTTSSGDLYIGINEGQTSDNRGSFIVRVRLYKFN